MLGMDAARSAAATKSKACCQPAGLPPPHSLQSTAGRLAPITSGALSLLCTLPCSYPAALPRLSCTLPPPILPRRAVAAAAHPQLTPPLAAPPPTDRPPTRPPTACAMSRRYPTAELYEERERDFYRNGNRSDRNYEDLDVELRRGSDPRRSAPDFFRDDRPTAGPMVLRGGRDRDRDDDTFSRAPPRSRRGGFDDDDALSLRSRAPPPPSAVRERDIDDISIRRSDTGGRGRRDVEREKEELDVTIRRREQSRGPPPRESRDIPFRNGAGARPREVSLERDDVRFRGRGDGIDIRASRKEFSRDGRDVSAERGSI